MKNSKSWIRFFTNRYVLVFILAVGWMLFFDRYDLPSQLRMNERVEELQDDRDYYASEIERLKKIKETLHSDPEELERFAREEYFMKKDDEIIFKTGKKQKDKN